jgi:hypothetical protein
MKKFLKDVVVTFVILGLICASFYQIGWLTSSKEVAILFAIAIVVIIANKITDILVLRIRRHK